MGRHQELGGKQIGFLLFDVGAFAGGVVAQPYLEITIDMDIVEIMQEVMPKLMGGRKISSIWMVVGVDANYRCLAIAIAVEKAGKLVFCGRLLHLDAEGLC